MLVKHILVVGLVALGVALDRIVARVGEATDANARESDLRLIRLGAEGATAPGALIALLTAAAQVAE